MSRFPVRHWLAALCLVCGPVAAAPLSVELEVRPPSARANIEATLSVIAALEADEQDRDLLLRLHARAEPQIRDALRAIGYYRPEIRITLDSTAKPATARYTVDAGPRTMLTAVEIEVDGEAADDPAVREALRRRPPRSGDTLHHGRYEAFKDELLRAASEGGFLDARFSRRKLLVDPDRAQARVELTLESGPRYTVGPVRIEQSVLAEDVIRRYVSVREGQPFRTDALVASRFRLADLGYFTSVQVEASRDEAVDNAIPVRFVLEPVAAEKYRIGAGYGTDTGARAVLGADWRYLNDRGHQMSADIRISEVAQELAGRYRIPLGEQVNEHIGLQATSLQETVGDIESRRIGGGISLTRQPGDWQRRVYLRFEREDFFGADEGSSKLTMPGVQFDRTRIDDAVRARLGWAVFADVHGAVAGALADTSFLQARATVRGVLPAFEASRVLLRAEAGGTALEEFAELPPSQRFFAGGDQSVRGYGYRRIGPRNADGEVIGGAFLTTASAEFETPLLGSWGAAVFVDAGGVDDDPNPPLRVGVGAGLRYLSPVGAIQVDLAHPLHGDRRGVRLHIGIRVGL